MEHPEEKTTVKEEPTTQKQESTTSKPEESTTKREESTTKAPVTTVPENTTFPNYIPQEIVTVPVINDVVATMPQDTPVVTPNYNITDNIPEEIGNGAPIAFLLVLFLVVIVSGAVLFLTMGRKNREEF